MNQHHIDAKIATEAATDQVQQDGYVATGWDDEKDAVSGDGDYVALVESHVDRQLRAGFCRGRRIASLCKSARTRIGTHRGASYEYGAIRCNNNLKSPAKKHDKYD